MRTQAIRTMIKGMELSDALFFLAMMKMETFREFNKDGSGRGFDVKDHDLIGADDEMVVLLTDNGDVLTILFPSDDGMFQVTFNVKRGTKSEIIDTY